MEWLQSIFDYPLFGTTAGNILLAVAYVVAGVIIALLVRWIGARLIHRRVEKANARQEPTETGSMVPPVQPPSGEFALRTVDSFLFPIIIIAALYAATQTLVISGAAWVWVNRVFVILLGLFIIRYVVVVINELFRRAARRQETGVANGRASVVRFRPLRSVAVLFVWLAGVLFVLDNLGFDITAAIAGLGIGGIAMALAAQALLGDLFAYFVILLDRPFEIGDFLIFGDILGSVEKIGVKTTRLRALTGEQISVPNSDLTNSRVHNYKRMERRRIVFQIGVVYGTPAEKLAAIPDMLREIIESKEFVQFDRAHFSAYGEWSLKFEVVYYVLSPDYTVYMDVQQGIYMSIYQRFEEEGVRFAYPTQVVQLAPDAKHDANRPAAAPPATGLNAD
jgi:small-conductance mechanosensitive channel